MDNRLEQYRLKAEAAVVKKLSDYATLHDMECELCAIINEGNAIRKELISNPDNIDRKSYLFLTNQVKDPTVLDKKYDCLRLIVFLSKNLYDAYLDYAKTLEEEQKYEELVNIYAALFGITRSNYYQKKIADLFFEHLDKTSEAVEIYRNIQHDYVSEYLFWEQLAKMYSKLNDSEQEAACAVLAKELKQKADAVQLVHDKKYDEAIEIYNKLYQTTGNCSYRLEVANIYAVFCDSINKSFEIYKELEEKLSEDCNYWYRLSDLYESVKNYYRQVLCIQKAIHLELNLINENRKEIV